MHQKSAPVESVFAPSIALKVPLMALVNPVAKGVLGQLTHNYIPLSFKTCQGYKILLGIFACLVSYYDRFLFACQGPEGSMLLQRGEWEVMAMMSPINDEPYYMHAKHMYNLDHMKFQKLTVSLSVLAAFSIGVAVPVYVVIFQQRKAVSG